MRRKDKLRKITKRDVYSIKDLMTSSSQKELGLQIPFDVYLQDPYVANEDPLFGFVDNFYISWFRILQEIGDFLKYLRIY